MTQEVFPEIEAARVALEGRIAVTEAEISEMQNTIAAKENLARGWRKAVMEIKAASPIAATASAVPQSFHDEWAF